MIATGLDLLTVAFEASGDVIHRHAFLLRFVRTDLTKHLSFVSEMVLPHDFCFKNRKKILVFGFALFSC